MRQWHHPQITDIEHEVKVSTEILVTTRTEIKDLKSTFQRLQIELQSNLSMVQCTYVF